MYHYLAFYSEVVNGKIISSGNLSVTLEAKIHSVEDFELLSETVCKEVGKKVTVHAPLLLDC